METTQNTAYFEEQLITASAGLNNSEVSLLISDMVKYSKEKEKSTIPPGKNQEQKPKPGEQRSVEFRQRIDELPGSIGTELISIFNDFLTYIQTLESPATD